MTKNKYQADIEAILAHRYDNGADYWTTADRRLLKGSPFSTLDCTAFLLELGVEPSDILLQEISQLFFAYWQQDGRIRLYPDGAIYPCQTIHGLEILCKLGHSADERIRKTFSHLLESQEADGGWKCNKYSFGRGEETNYSNPLPTLIALNAFRYFGEKDEYQNELDNAVEFLLQHWEIKQPIGPCHYGIGTLFMQVEYPFRNYNLFQYVYILSFYEYARKDKRFQEAFCALQDHLVDEMIVVERVVPKLAKLKFCEKGQPSELATQRYREIVDNLNNN